MNLKSVSMCSVAAVMLLAGCSQMHKQERQVATVSLRFAMPPNDASFEFAPTNEFQTTGTDAQNDVQGGDVQDGDANATTATFTQASDADFDAVSDAPISKERYFVTMWGGPYDGEDVTYSDLDLAPGDYTFAVWEQDPQSTVQGNLTVNPPSTALLDVLQKWQARIPELKQQLAFDAEIKGKANTDAQSFSAFKRQLSALERLGDQIDRAVWWQEKWNKRHAPEYEHFVDQAVLLVLPGDERQLDPRTRPAFCASDVENVRDGSPLTKVLYVADYDSAQWKARMIDGFWRELIACKNVHWEEVNRYERRKRILDITDHLYKHDAEFVRNEQQLQTALNTIAMIDQQLADLSDRRVTLALAHALTASHEPFASFDTEFRDLEQERTMLTAEKERLDAMYEKAGAETPKRVDLAAARQRYVRALAQVEQRFAAVKQNQIVVATLRENSEVLHRNSDARVLASTIVTDSVPFNVRQAITRESVLTLRLQSQENLFAPKGSNLNTVRTAAHNTNRGQ
jgi:hypothetical protein